MVAQRDAKFFTKKSHLKAIKIGINEKNSCFSTNCVIPNL